MGVYSGYATLLFGGENGDAISIEEGDAVAIPAGVGHKLIQASNDFGLIGAYPNGIEYDVMKGKEGERTQALENISKVALPENDPVYGKMEGLTALWKEKK